MDAEVEVEGVEVEPVLVDEATFVAVRLSSGAFVKGAVIGRFSFFDPFGRRLALSLFLSLALRSFNALTI